MSPGFDAAGAAPTVVREFRIPRAGTLRNMRVHVRVPGGGTDTISYTLQVNGVDTLLVVTMAATAADGSDLVNAPVVAAGDLIGIKITKSGNTAPSPSDVLCSVEEGV
jgi:hypothetical protein